MEVAELTSVCESLSGQIKRLSARVGMREVRERRQDSNEPVDSGGPAVVDRAKLKAIARAQGLLK